MKMIRICAWCKRPIGLRSRVLKWFGGQAEHQVSHGICWRCKKDQLDRLQTLPKDGEDQPDMKEPLQQEVT